MGVGTLLLSGEINPFTFIFDMFFAVLLWPFAIGFEAIGSFDEDEGSTLVIYGSVFLGFVFTQIRAIFMILKRADKMTDLDMD